MLSRDVPDGARVGGNPGRVVMQHYENGPLLGERERASAPGPVSVKVQKEATPA
jgi:hypothetical protein